CWHGRGDALDSLHQLLEAAATQEDLALAAVQDSREKGPLETENRQHPLLDGALRDEVHDLHGARLTEPVHPADSLLEDRGVPRRAEVHDHAGMLEVETPPARIGRQECPATRVVPETFDEDPSPPCLDAAVKEHVIPPPAFEPGAEHFVHPEPLAEDHRL